MSSYDNIFEVLNGGRNAGYIGDHLEEYTPDQRIAIAQVIATAAIAEEISALNPQNTITTREGRTYNGWGTPTS